MKPRRQFERGRAAVLALCELAHRGKTSRNMECTPGYYNFEGESNRRQDGNYNGGFKQYFRHQGAVRERMEENFEFG